MAGSAKTPQLDPVVQEALKDVTSRTHPLDSFSLVERHSLCGISSRLISRGGAFFKVDRRPWSLNGA